MGLSVTVMVVWEGTTITIENYYEKVNEDDYPKIYHAAALLGDAHDRAKAALEAQYKEA